MVILLILCGAWLFCVVLLGAFVVLFFFGACGVVCGVVIMVYEYVVLGA